ncbi:MAG TPA: DUF4342 domain-containing protein [Vicinamibacterales bacterium]|nr:DUF4342 domain-containing protein [Vicinamibacterales bacterium]
MTKETFWQTIEVKGDELLDKVKELIAEGNVRRVRIRQKQQTIVEFPLTVGVVGAVLAPVLAAVGALAALVTECTIDLERTHGEEAVPVAAGGREMDEEC